MPAGPQESDPTAPTRATAPGPATAPPPAIAVRPAHPGELAAAGAVVRLAYEADGHGGDSGRYDRLKDQPFEYAWLLSQVGITK